MSIVRVLIGLALAAAAAAGVAMLPGLNNVVIVVGVFVAVATLIPVIGSLQGHPKGLFILFFAEMWERFSYYGMRGLLIFYLTQQFLFDDGFSARQYGAYTTLVYLLPLIGGFVADRWLGTRKAVAFGALLLVAGHFTMGIEGKPAVQTLAYNGATYSFQATGRMEKRHVCLKVGDGCYETQGADNGGIEIKGLPDGAPLPKVLPAGSYTKGVEARDPLYVNIFYLALSLIIMGVGFLKANISSIVGQLYPAGDPRRDPGFTLYYYGINLGAFLASIFCSYLGTNYGWKYGFGLAGVGMLVGFIVFVLGKPLLEGKAEPPNPELLKKGVGPLNVETLIYLFGFAALAGVFFLVREFALIGTFLIPIAFVSGTYLIAGLGIRGPLLFLLGLVLPAAIAAAQTYMHFPWWFNFAPLGLVTLMSLPNAKWGEVGRLLLALTLIGGSVMFFALFEQAGSSLNQFAERNTQLALWPTQTMQLFGYTIDMSFTAAQAQAFNAGFILLLAPVFSAIWAVLGRMNRDPHPLFKFGLGLAQVGAGFFVLIWGSQFHDAAFKVPLIFLALAYLMHTTGELCLSPVGLSQMTKLAPAGLLSTLMATWFLGTSLAQYAAALIAQTTASETVAGQVLDPAKALDTYVHVFQQIGTYGIVLGGVFIGLGLVVVIFRSVTGGTKSA